MYCDSRKRIPQRVFHEFDTRISFELLLLQEHLLRFHPFLCESFLKPKREDEEEAAATDNTFVGPNAVEVDGSGSEREMHSNNE